MIPFLISSTVLMAAVILLRQVFKNRISRRLQYGLWLIVLIRLVLPVQLGTSPVSIDQSAPVKQVESVVTGTVREPVAGPSYTVIYNQVAQEYVSAGQNIQIPEIQTQVHTETTQRISAPTFAEIANTVWLTGAVLMGLWFLFVNLRFGHTLRKFSTEITVADCPTPVKVCPRLQSPCLSGFGRPTVYLTENFAADPQRLRHILAHELTHLRHGDLLWSAVRSILLCVYWFHPLVWVSAILSKRDCELACDEGALKRLGEDQRIPYGRTLLDTVARTPSPHHLLETATSMNETKKQLKERVNFIVKKPKFYLILTVCVLLIIAVAAACTFTGAPEPTLTPTEPTETTAAPTEPTETEPRDPRLFNDEQLAELQALFTGYYNMRTNWYNAAMLATFDSPYNLYAYDLFSVGTGDPTDAQLTDEELAFLQDTNFQEAGYGATRMSREYADSVLTRLFGLTTADIEMESRWLKYWDKTDCYYIISEGHAAMDFRLLGARYQENDIILIEYYNPYTLNITVQQMTLQPVSGGYHILSNREIPRSTLYPDAKLVSETWNDDIRSLFANHAHGINWLYASLRSTFSSTEYINFYTLLYGVQSGATISQQELDFLRANGMDPDGAPIQKFSVSFLDEILTRYFGLPFAQCAGIGLEKMVYNPETDSYYCQYTDYTPGTVAFTGMETHSNGVTFYYEYILNSQHTAMRVFLEKQADSYTIVSNTSGNDPSANNGWYPYASPKPLSYNEYFSTVHVFYDYCTTHVTRWCVTENGSLGTLYSEGIPNPGFALCHDEDGFFIISFPDDEQVSAKPTGTRREDKFYLDSSGAPLDVIWEVPGSGSIGTFDCCLTDGKYAYLVQNQNTILCLDLWTGEITTVFQGDHIPTESPACIQLYDQSILIFLTQSGNNLAINRLHLASGIHDVLYSQIPMDCFRAFFSFYCPDSDTLCWVTMNPDYFTRLLDILKDPESSAYNKQTKEIIKYHTLFSGDNSIWDCLGLGSLIAHPDFIELVQLVETLEEKPSQIIHTYTISDGNHQQTPHYWDAHMNE